MHPYSEATYARQSTLKKYVRPWGSEDGETVELRLKKRLFDAPFVPVEYIYSYYERT